MISEGLLEGSGIGVLSDYPAAIVTAIDDSASVVNRKSIA
jgi:hypothetical protein